MRENVALFCMFGLFRSMMFMMDKTRAAYGEWDMAFKNLLNHRFSLLSSNE